MQSYYWWLVNQVGFKMKRLICSACHWHYWENHCIIAILIITILDFLYKHIVYQISGLKITHAVYAYALYMYLYLQYLMKNRKHRCKGGHHNVSFLSISKHKKLTDLLWLLNIWSIVELTFSQKITFAFCS